MTSRQTEAPYWDITRKVIGAAFEVHKTLGPGFLEKVYVNSLVTELAEARIKTAVEVGIPVQYKGYEVGQYYADIVVEENVICEIKAVAAISPAHEAQLLNYLKATGVKVGLLLNFGSKSVEVKRMVL